jgi:hypothetical protein
MLNRKLDVCFVQIRLVRYHLTHFFFFSFVSTRCSCAKFCVLRHVSKKNWRKKKYLGGSTFPIDFFLQMCAIETEFGEKKIQKNKSYCLQ